MRAGFPHIHMRIGLVGDKNLSVPDHTLRHHRMKVERHRNGNIHPKFGPQKAEQIAFSVLAELWHH